MNKPYDAIVVGSGPGRKHGGPMCTGHCAGAAV
jgi:hypothetical protein